MLLHLAGWSGLTDRLERDPVSRAIIAKKGMGLGVSAVFGPLWVAYAIYFMTGSAAAAAVAATVVLMLVLTLDRDFIFAQETQSRVSPVGAVRIPLVLVLAFPTAIALFVFVNQPALDATASDTRTERAAARQEKIDDVTGLGRARDAEGAAGKTLAALREQRLKVPPDIVVRKTGAVDCGRSVERRYMALLTRDDVGTRVARVAVAAERARCSALDRAAQEAERAYFEALDLDIGRAVQAADNAISRSATAADQKADLTRKASEVDERAVEARSMAVVSRYIDDHPLAVIELIALYVLVVVLDGAGLWVSAILSRSPAGAAFERDVAQARAESAAEATLAIQIVEWAGAHIRQSRRAAKGNDALPHIRAEMAETSRAVATAEAEQMRRIAPFLAVAGSMDAMVKASEAAADAARRAHERDPAIGRLADGMMDRAVKQALREVAA